MDTKICTGCKREKSLDLFGMKAGKKNTRCKECFNKYYHEYWKNTEAYTKHRENIQAKRDADPVAYRASKYNLTKEELLALIARHDGMCWLCKNKKATAIDHCHISKKVRGMLCNSCNTGLGKLGDSVDSLRKAIEYIQAAEA